MENHSDENKNFLDFCSKIIMIVVLLGLSLFFYGKMIDASTLVDRGVSTSAKLLEYRPSDNGKVHDSYYLISYDTYNELIEVYGGDYHINNNISVIYDRENPKLVWLGNSDMSALNLYCLNTNLVRDVTKVIIMILLCIAIINPRKRSRGRRIYFNYLSQTRNQ